MASVNCSVAFATAAAGTPVIVNAPDASAVARYERPDPVSRNTLDAPGAVPFTVTPAVLASTIDVGTAIPATAMTPARATERIFIGLPLLSRPIIR